MGDRKDQIHAAHPYVHIDHVETDEGQPYIDHTVVETAATRPHAQLQAPSATKAALRSGLTEIFMPYVPAHQPRKLPLHFRDFIARNENRDGAQRYRLLQHMQRYNIGSTSGVRPHFNRELPEEITEQKLREIERLLLDE